MIVVVVLDVLAVAAASGLGSAALQFSSCAGSVQHRQTVA